MRIDISSRSGPYAVESAETISQAVSRACVAGKTWVLADASVFALHDEAILESVSRERILTLEANEEAKSFERLAPVFTWLLKGGFKRDCTLLAIGGGVIQDISAFVATVLVRGIRWDFIPTTLLAQCDSCIGAKSSINIGSYKNQLGSFYPPAVIHLVPAVLATLPREAVFSGLGEVIKFHLLDGKPAWEAIQRELLPERIPALEPLIWTSLGIKKRYIEVDELDTGIRNLLNYGHTFGHAFESATGFGIPHGIGVALGMSAATFISARRHLVSAEHFLEVDSVLRRIYRPFEQRLRDAGMESILSGMRADKKNTHGATYVILTNGPGAMVKTKVDLDKEIAPLLTEFIRAIQA